MYADDQIIMVNSENNRKRAVNLPSHITEHCNIKISANETKFTTFPGKISLRTKLTNNGTKLNNFNCLGNNIS